MLPNLSYGLSRIQGVSSNHFMLEPNNSSSATAGGISRFSLPENALWNTRETVLHFNATCAGAGTGARLPPKISSLVSSYRLLAGGVQLSSGNNLYNVLVHAKDALCGNKSDSVLSHPEMVRTTSYVNGVSFTTTTVSGTAVPNPERYSAGTRRFAIANWEGILGSLEPKVIDTSHFPSLTLEIVWASNAVLSSVAGFLLPGSKTTDDNDTPSTLTFTDNGTGGGTYQVTDLQLSINVIGLASSLLDEMVQSRMASTGYLELPFQNHFVTENTHTGSTRFSVATQSLDRVIVAQRSDGFDTQKAPIRVSGHAGAIGYAPSKPSADLSAAGKAYIASANGVTISGSSVAGFGDTNKEKYIPCFFNFKETASGGSAPKYQFQIQGTQLPQVECSAEQMYIISKNAMDLKHIEQTMTLKQYKDNYAVQAIRLCLPTSQEHRVIAGLDTRGVSLDGQWKASGLANTTNCVVICECTSSIRLGAARSLEVVV